MSSFRASVTSASGSARDDVVSFGATAASEGQAVVVPDAHLLFNASFQRVAGDLVLTDERGHRFVVSDYFATDRHPDLVSPQGAVLTADVVDRLAGPLAPGATAQAGAAGAATAAAIGRVEAASGDAAVVRNGVVIALNVGDVVLKGDVVQTGQGSSVALTFLDGTAFNLSANARMVLNELVYNEGQPGNQALLSLVQGSISFLAGQIAKTGDMRVDTPVTTMGIRGTAVLVDILANDGTARFSVMVEQSGVVGSYVLLSKQTGQVLATVNQADTVFLVTPTGSGSVSVQSLAKTPQDFAQEGALVSFLTPLAIIPQLPQPGDQTPGGPNLNPRAGKGGSGSGAAGDGNAGDPGDDFGGPGIGLKTSFELKDANGLNLITAFFPFSEPVKEFVFTPAPLIPVTVIAINDVQTILPQITTVTIPNQVFIQSTASFVPFIADSVAIVNVVGPGVLPAGLNLASLLTLNPGQGTITYDNSAFSFLAQGEKVVYTIQFTAQVNGQTVTEILPITITGINDAPALEVQGEAVTLTDGAVPTATATPVAEESASADPAASGPSSAAAAAKATVPAPTVATVGDKVVTKGAIAFKDADLSDTHSVTVTPAAGSSGTVTATLVDSTGAGKGEVDWTYSVDKASLQALGAGETRVESFAVSIADGKGGVATETVAVTLVGVNDAPTVASASTTGSVTDPGDGSCTLAATGSFAFADADLSDTHTIRVTPPACALGTLTAKLVDSTGTGTGTVTWSYEVDKALLASLGVGETRTESFVVTIQDPYKGAVEETVTVDIVGANDAPVVTFVSAPASVADGAGHPATTGSLSFADADLHDLHAVAVAPEAGTLGAVQATLTEAGGHGAVSWCYEVDKTVLQALGAGETKLDSFVFTVSDGHGGTAQQSVGMTLVGVNDAPTVSVTDVADVASCEPSAKGFSLAAQTAITDPDLHDAKTAYVEGSGRVAHVEGPHCAPADLGSLVCLDASTGEVGYDPAAFDFLEPGQSVVYTIDYLSRSGPDTVCSTLHLTISGPAAGSEAASGPAAAPVAIELAGSPVVAGSAGDDMFHFTDATVAAVVSDFHPAARGGADHDLIVVDHALFATVDAVLSAAVETPDGSTLIATPDHSLLLKGVHLADLKASDFLIG
ncbi:MAG: VCBS domain-containing protein [Alsobacter sp.]